MTDDKKLMQQMFNALDIAEFVNQVQPATMRPFTQEDIKAHQHVPEVDFGNIALSEHALNHAISQATCSVANGSETSHVHAIGKALWRQFQAQYQAEQKPYCWNVEGTREIYTGEFAESDARGSARRIGGTCRARALFMSPAPTQKPLDENEVRDMADAICTADMHCSSEWNLALTRVIERAHGINSLTIL